MQSFLTASASPSRVQARRETRAQPARARQARGRDGRGRGLAGLHHRAGARAGRAALLPPWRERAGQPDLARLTGLPKPTISRITYTLTELGYLRYHPDTGKYSPGYGVLALGYGLLAGLEVRELAKASMTELARQTGGAVALAPSTATP